MARNAERANAVLNKWLAVKDAVIKGVATRERRPRDVTQCNDLQQAEKWRAEVMRGIGRMIAQVQDASLGEHRIRDLNDDINKFIRVKKAWEARIKELGGPDYSASSASLEAMSKMSAAGVDGYMYFGAAKELKGVRELLEREALEDHKPRVTRAMLFKRITPDYYGWRDEDDGELLLAEHAKEAELRQQADEEGRKVTEEDTYDQQETRRPKKSRKTHSRARKGARSGEPTAEEEEESTLEAYIGVPTADDIAQLLLEKKKQMILEKYVSKQQASAQEESRNLAKQP